MAVLDEFILQCLILDGRAPLRRIAGVVGVSEQTVARRVRDMAAGGVARVVVEPSNFSASRRAWNVRIRCRPDASAALAEALAERTDVRRVALVSGGSEINCTASGPLGAETSGVLARLPRTEAVLSFSAQALLHPFAPGAGDWAIFDERLTVEQAARVARWPYRPPDQSVTFADTDDPLIAALARNGRGSAAALAREIGWPVSRTSARLDALLSSGLLQVATAFLPEAFGYHATAIMYLTVPPGRVVEVGEALTEHRETGFVGAATGTANVLAVVTCRSSDHLFRYVSDKVGALPGVNQVELVPYLRRIKQTSCRVIDGRLAEAN